MLLLDFSIDTEELPTDVDEVLNTDELSASTGMAAAAMASAVAQDRIFGMGRRMGIFSEKSYWTVAEG
jgi:hypothetical protein